MNSFGLSELSAHFHARVSILGIVGQLFMYFPGLLFHASGCLQWGVVIEIAMKIKKKTWNEFNSDTSNDVNYQGGNISIYKSPQYLGNFGIRRNRTLAVGVFTNLSSRLAARN